MRSRIGLGAVGGDGVTETIVVGSEPLHRFRQSHRESVSNQLFRGCAQRFGFDYEMLVQRVEKADLRTDQHGR